MRLPEDELAAFKEAGLLRSLRETSSNEPPIIETGSKALINFSSNDYLGLSSHPLLKEAACEATKRWGTGSGASRLVSGSHRPHHELEESLAALKNSEAALTFANGYTTAVGTITSLVGPGDTVILDKLSHASLIDGARLSGATIRVYPHNNLEKLAKLLQSSEEKGQRTLVVTESVFSMDGDLCPLREIIELKQRHGALLLLDEAHGLGVLGSTGLGLAEVLGVQDHIDFQMGTLGKAVGSAGGYLASSRAFVDLLINKARSFIYSTAPPPAQAAAALAGLRVITSDEGAALRKKLHEHIARCAKACPAGRPQESSIIPLILGENDLTLKAAEKLRDAGILVPAIRYPTVAKNQARLRISLSAAHTTEHISSLLDAISLLEKNEGSGHLPT